MTSRKDCYLPQGTAKNVTSWNGILRAPARRPTSDGRLPRRARETFSSLAQRLQADSRGTSFGVPAVRPWRPSQGPAALKQAVQKEKELGYWEPPHYARPVLGSLAEAQIAAGDFTSARQSYEQELKLRPRNGHALLGLARTFAREGKDAEARAAYANFAQAWSGADAALTVHLTDRGYGRPALHRTIAARSEVLVDLPLATSHGWYDLGLTVDGHPHYTRRYAGRIETGRPSRSDPVMGREVRG